MPTPFGRSHCPLQSGNFDSSCAPALVIAVANARKAAMAAVGLWRGCMATSEELASKGKNTTQRTRCESFSDCRHAVLSRLLRYAGRLFFESSSRFSFLFEHDLFRKPLHTFRDHALGGHQLAGTSVANFVSVSPRAPTALQNSNLGRERVTREQGHSVFELHAHTSATTQ